MFPPRPITVLAILACGECKKIQNKYFSINLIASVPSFASCRDWFWHRWIGGYLPPKVVQNRCARIQGIDTYSLYGKQILKVVFCGTIHYNLKARLHLDENLLQKSLLLTNQCWPCVHEAQIARRPRRDVRSFSFFRLYDIKMAIMKAIDGGMGMKYHFFFN